MIVPFWLKKYLSSLLLPTPIGLLFISVGIVLLVIQRAKRTGLILNITGFLIMMFFSLGPISGTLLNTLESQYPPLLHPPNAITNIVVLGAGAGVDKNYPPNLTLNNASLSRLIEGIRVFNQLKAMGGKPTLILSGGRVFTSPAVSGKMHNTAATLGVPPDQMMLENGSRDTREEALYLRKTLGKSAFILVTSAVHMPRAMALFEALGLHPIAAPTQFSDVQPNVFSWCIPSSLSLIASDLAIHEYLGLWWAKINKYT